MDDTLPASARTGRHLGRLWAREEVERLRAAGRIREARELAVAWQLVTPVSGAVVLENERQYQEAGLEPVDPETVPAIPEPGTKVLWLIGLGWLLWGRSRRRAARRRHG
ncbi:MAG: PEP-CTERM sorting domain-containing protein [Verrucomicrobia bacterium]|nr:MAG: PEP-CTERM sorting domain-containing protein [Verrucomicrobiota bacterium]